ncbi:MAG: hypothetical protein IT290_02610 [Deltaproteobacteria bacterium]|nr:hypothetical protein [Deltaproteobacteria bacterium]
MNAAGSLSISTVSGSGKVTGDFMRTIIVGGIGLAATLLSSHLFATEARAQGQNLFQSSSRVEELVTMPNANDPRRTYRKPGRAGWGSERTPIFFNSTVQGQNPADPASTVRIYPSLADSRNPMDSDQFLAVNRRQSIRRMHLGTDDEVKKSALPLYISLPAMQKDWAGDINDRDRHLNLFESIRGVAELTLSYLDKTVAAGLATVQEQANDHAELQMLKQIQWTNNRLANPQRAMLYNDTDRKLEACLLYNNNLVQQQTGERIQFPNFTGAGPFTSEDNACSQSCLTRNNLGTQWNAPPRSFDQGLYAYCVCCAESWETPNNSQPSAGTPAGGGAFDGVTSLVQVIFYGTNQGNALGGDPFGRWTPNNPNYADSIKRVEKSFREMYGDILLERCNSNAFDSPGGAGHQGQIPPDSAACTQFGAGLWKTKYEFPFYSVADRIKAFRDGGCGAACPLQNLDINQGICPAVREILARWPWEQNEYTTLQQLWTQASMGYMLVADDFRNMFTKMGITEGSLRAQAVDPATWQPTGVFGRWLSDFCDASAVSGFKRYHVRMMTVIEDHLRMNRHASDYEKGMIRDLMARVSADIDLAERDRTSKEMAEQFLNDLATEGDQQEVSNSTSSFEGFRSRFHTTRVNSAIGSFGGIDGVPADNGGGPPAP